MNSMGPMNFFRTTDTTDTTDTTIWKPGFSRKETAMVRSLRRRSSFLKKLLGLRLTKKSLSRNQTKVIDFGQAKTGA